MGAGAYRSSSPVLCSSTANTDVMYAQADANAKSVTGQLYTTEYILLFRLEDTATSENHAAPKILEIVEFADSLFTSRFLAKEKELMGAEAASSS